MNTVLLATGNAGKVRELRHLLQGSAEVQTPGDLGLELQVEETGSTFEENAVIKAKAYFQATQMICIADDSGLCVDALSGAPGVHSARFAMDAGRGQGDADNRALLQEQMADVPDGQRTAAFFCVVAIAAPNTDIQTFEGTCPGVITRLPRGESGFGYDPLFEAVPGKTFAEIPLEQKQALSHRGNALRQAVPYLQQLLASA